VTSTQAKTPIKYATDLTNTTQVWVHLWEVDQARISFHLWRENFGNVGWGGNDGIFGDFHLVARKLAVTCLRLHILIICNYLPVQKCTNTGNASKILDRLTD
jgi:hypothetical protein